jgi:hypothetical protein
MIRLVRWRRSGRGGEQLVGWLANRQLDEALRVFGALESATAAEHIDDELRALLHAAALDVLDDAADLAPLVAASPDWPIVPLDPATALRRDVAEDEGDDDVYAAVRALAGYATRLVEVTALLSRRRSTATRTFARLADAATARMELLAS